MLNQLEQPQQEGEQPVEALNSELLPREAERYQGLKPLEAAQCQDLTPLEVAPIPADSSLRAVAEPGTEAPRLEAAQLEAVQPKAEREGLLQQEREQEEPAWLLPFPLL